MKESIRSHYIPQFYLRNFGDGDNIFVFDRQTKTLKEQPIKVTAAVKNFYAIGAERGGGGSRLEGAFAELEGEADVIIDKIKNRKKLSDAERVSFSWFVAFQLTRVPDYKKRVEEGAEKMMKKLNEFAFSNKEWVANTAKKVGLQLDNEEVESLANFAGDKSRYHIKFQPEFWIDSMLYTTTDVADIFLNMHWLILFSNRKNAFITSDNPLTLVPPNDYNPNSIYGVGLITGGTKKIFPLASDICLMITDLSTKPQVVYTDLEDGVICRHINYLAARNSDRFVFSAERGKLEKIIKDTKIDTWLKKERVGVG